MGGRACEPRKVAAPGQPRLPDPPGRGIDIRYVPALALGWCDVCCLPSSPARLSARPGHCDLIELRLRNVAGRNKQPLIPRESAYNYKTEAGKFFAEWGGFLVISGGWWSRAHFSDSKRALFVYRDGLVGSASILGSQ